MKRVSFFVRARSVMAPFVRPLLESCPPVRAFGLWWLSRRQRSVIEHGGHRFELDPRDFGVTFELEATGEYERKTRELCMASLKPGMTFVDVGAHVGLYAIPAAKVVGPNGKVFAFDPDPDNFALLSRNVAASGYSNIQLNNAAVSNVNGQLKLHRSPYNTGDHQIFFKGSGRETVSVQSVTLDEFFKGRTDSIDVAKFDIQGAEAAALQGMSAILANSRNLRMFIEFAPSMLEDADADPLAFLRSIESHGFVLSIIDDADGSVTQADAEVIVQSSRKKAYINIMCDRQAQSQ